MEYKGFNLPTEVVTRDEVQQLLKQGDEAAQYALRALMDIRVERMMMGLIDQFEAISEAQQAVA